MSTFATYFNSRPHGGRRRNGAIGSKKIYFNSRPHGGRLTAAEVSGITGVFQLTPSRRATTYVAAVLSMSIISTHALTEGDITRPIASTTSSFQLTPSRRATENAKNGIMTLLFQLTPSRRATTGITTGKAIRLHFNSRPHGGRLDCCFCTGRS